MVCKIYFDLDGVLADFDRGVMELAGFDRNGATANSGIKDDDMWQAIAKVPNFYDKLELIPGAKELFDAVYQKYGDKVEILTGIPKPKRNITTAAEDKTPLLLLLFSKSCAILPTTGEHLPTVRLMKSYCRFFIRRITICRLYGQLWWWLLPIPFTTSAPSRPRRDSTPSPHWALLILRQ